MNNKGFTLVELLAVIVILLSISAVAVWSISSSLDRRDEKEVEEQTQLAIDAAKIYFSLSSEKCVKIKDLIDQNYFSGVDKVDKLDTEYYIQLKENSYYSYVSSCS